MTTNYHAKKVLRASGFETLPITSDDIRHLMERHKWRFQAYGNGEKSEAFLKELRLEDIAKKSKAFSCRVGKEKIVFYQESMTESERTFAFAHEHGHGSLKHESPSGLMGYNEDGTINEEQEREANKFAAYLLAPPPVLRKAKIYSSHAIQKYTLVPEALIPYVLVNLHNCDNETDFTPEDRALCAQFYQFWAKPFRKKIIKLHRKLHSLLSRLITKIRTSKRILAKHHRKILDGHIVPDDYDPQTMVLVAKHGKSYHDMRCVGAKRVNLKAMTVVEALKNGYQPCGLCRKKDMDLRTLKKVFSDQQLVEFRAFIDAIYQVVKMTGVTYEFTCPICGDTASASRNKKDGSYIAKCDHCHTSIRL